MIGLRRASRLTIWPLRKQLLGPPIPESHDGMVSFVLVLNLKDIAGRSISQLRQNVLKCWTIEMRWEANAAGRCWAGW